MAYLCGCGQLFNCQSDHMQHQNHRRCSAFAATSVAAESVVCAHQSLTHAHATLNEEDDMPPLQEVSDNKDKDNDDEEDNGPGACMDVSQVQTMYHHIHCADCLQTGGQACVG
jgi:hypothetical protein